MHVALETVSSMSEMLIGVTVTPFSRKGLDDGLCEIQRLFWFTAVCSCSIGLTLKMHMRLGVIHLGRKRLKYCPIPLSWRGRGSSGHGSNLTLKSSKPHLIWQLAPLPSNRGSPLLAPARHLPCAGPSVPTVSWRVISRNDRAKIAYVLTPQQC